MSGTNIERALLIPIDPVKKQAVIAQQIQVQFNPESLKLTRTVTVEADTKSKNTSSQAAQQASNSSAKLSLDLVFDTTDTFEQDQDGADVTKVTGKIVAAFVNPPVPDNAPPNKPIPASPCLFVWGTFQFMGLVESYSETLEFFSASGVPLRSAVSLSLQENRYNLAKESLPARTPGTAQPLPAGSSIAPAMAGAGLDPTDWRGTAMANGLETPRFSISASIDVSAGASFSATASASAGVGFSVGASADLGTGIPGAFSAGAGASLGAGANASFG